MNGMNCSSQDEENMKKQTLVAQTSLQNLAQLQRDTKPIRKQLGVIPILVALLTTLMTCSPVAIHAQTPEEDPIIVSFEQYDLNADTRPDQAILLVDHMGARRRVVVYDQGQDMAWNDDWRQGTDFSNDVWLFQNEAGDQTKLIIRFSHDPTGYTAELFDDESGDGMVSYTVDASNQVQITESKLPIARFTAEQPWILADGTVNYMVRITAYGRLHNMISGIGWDVNMLPNDGRLAWSQEVVDLDSDFIPDYELIQVFPDIPDDWKVYRTYLKLNVGKEPPLGFSNSMLWPYLGNADVEGWKPGYLERKPDNHLYTPPVQFDWESGRILGVGNFLPGYGRGNRYGFLSMTPLRKGEVNVLDFDRAVHYNFSDSSTPDMFFRLIRNGPEDSVQVGPTTLYAEQAGFSWHHRRLGTLQWDYKLELAGLYETPPTLMQFKDFSLRDVPFEDLLSWFTERNSAYATFVAAEENSYASNEGIWEWMTLAGVVEDVSNGLTTIPGTSDAQRGYILGKSDISPEQYYTDIREGFRGEYGEINGLAQLYLSPVDHKLHLLKTKTGVWNLGNTREIRYKNLGGDYISQWTLVDAGYSSKELYVTPEFVLLWDAKNGMRLVRSPIQPAIFNTVPPRDREEWLLLGDALNQYAPTFEPDDFGAMFDQFAGPKLSVTQSSLRDFRLTKSGFRFVLALEPGFQVIGPDLLELTGLSAGEYLVENRDEVFLVSQLEPPRLSLALSPPQIADAVSPVLIAVQNTGLADALDLTLVAEAEVSDGSIVELAHDSVNALAGESEQFPIDIPSKVGTDVNLRVRLEDGQGQVLAELAPTPLTGTPLVSRDAIFSIWQVPIVAPIVGVFAALLALAAWLGASRRREQVA